MRSGVEAAERADDRCGEDDVADQAKADEKNARDATGDKQGGVWHVIRGEAKKSSFLDFGYGGGGGGGY